MLRLILSAILLCTMSSSYASITLGATRVIYEGGKKEASISLGNKGDEIPYLIQSWVTKFDDTNKNTPFVITPPLFKLPSETENLIRISYVREVLPQDRESLFALNINAIPAIDKKEQSRILIATKSVLKLIYRPAALSNKEAATAYEKVTAMRTKDAIRLHNPTPYYINIGMFKVDDKALKNVGYIAPFSDKVITGANNNARNITLKAINDYGGLTTGKIVNIQG
ncbi:P pilus assembly chaperone PapD [Serratia fonticola]|jgi:P pilus assembly chaperone PapD|uniref:P pilus assembly chaperone PapD n=1 Tax=Serratia fonticola TaxID=47917 RepID=A0A559T4J5_SERFO|nr:molecular chaperone [Serratia fonticola]TQI77977.1 P pilus assembly chaperone PapD [Serratia fonticola]TQI95025.1 P pilus assembly chaperone PapD [Serratia fonticola]TVZ69523.1 P pilus assembly chaperone PapD [Serratia fonticola]